MSLPEKEGRETPTNRTKRGNYKPDKGRQVVLGVSQADPTRFKYLCDLKRDKSRTAVEALREWVTTPVVALGCEGLGLVVATIDTECYRVTVRKVADIGERFPLGMMPDAEED